RDYTAGVRDVLGDKYAGAVREATYESTDSSVDRQIVQFKAAGCDALIVAILPPFAVQALRKVRDLSWKPIFFMNNVSTSIPIVLQPAGLESSIGLLSSAYVKDPLDPAFENDSGLKDWRAWMSKYLPGEDVRRPSFVFGYNSAAALVQVLKQAGNDLSRENIMRQATNLRDVELPGHQGQHQPDRLLSGPAVAAGALRRQALGALRGFGLRRVTGPCGGIKRPCGRARSRALVSSNEENSGPIPARQL